MANKLLKLDDEQRNGLTEWLADPNNLNPHDAFRAMQIAPGAGGYSTREELELTPLDHIARKFGYVTDRTKNAEALHLAQDTLLPFVQKAIGQKLLMRQQQEMGPTYSEAQQRGIGIPAPMQERLTTFPGSAELPGTFDIDQLQPGPAVGMTPSSIQFGQPGSQVARPIRDAPTYQPTTMPLQDANPQAKLSPTDLRLYEQVLGGHGVMDEGKYVPMPLARPRPDLMSADQILEQVKFNRSLGNVDTDTVNGLLQAPPSIDLPRATVQAALTEAGRRKLELSKQQGTHSLDDMSVAVTGMGLAQLPPDATVTPAYRQRIAQLVPGMQVPLGTSVRQAIAGMKAVAVPKMLANERAIGAQMAALTVPDKPSSAERKDVTEELGVIQRLDDLGKMFSAAYVGPLRGRVGSVLEIFGGIGEQEADFRAEIATVKNQVIKQITGAQMSEPEANRIMRQIPDANNPPEVFKARLDRSRKNAVILAYIHREVLQKSGIATEQLPPLPTLPTEFAEDYARMRGESVVLKSAKSPAPKNLDKKLDQLFDELKKAK